MGAMYRRFLGVLTCLFVCALLGFAGGGAGASLSGQVAMVEQTVGLHVPPTDRPVLDPFRDPGAPWQAGNRGIEYDTEPGDPIRASADGEVVFAGQVAGNLFVTVRHTVNLVTTMAFVAEITVAVGDVVEQGDVLAVAGDTFHFTARRNGAYIDPELLFGRLSYVVRLIPPR